ncbi:hypothetical protein GGS21DRAFT_194321 [Xylaria nigripes]|nr:hypothetical protein GGS21DRAFT_194321 [Xylaria nigripes]
MLLAHGACLFMGAEGLQQEIYRLAPGSEVRRTFVGCFEVDEVLIPSCTALHNCIIYTITYHLNTIVALLCIYEMLHLHVVYKYICTPKSANVVHERGCDVHSLHHPSRPRRRLPASINITS